MMIHCRQELIRFLKLAPEYVKISFLDEDSSLLDEVTEIKTKPECDLYLEPAFDGSSFYRLYSLDEDTGEVEYKGTADPEAIALLIYSVGYWENLLIQILDYDPKLPIPELVE